MKKIFSIATLLLLSANLVFAADTKITGMTADTSPTADDLVVTVNDPGGSPANRKSTLGNVLKLRTVATNTPLSGGGNLSGDLSLSIANSAADGSTKGAATFTAADFNASSGNISIDYTNAQAASASNKGFLTTTDWSTFNGKVAGPGSSTANQISTFSDTTGASIQACSAQCSGTTLSTTGAIQGDTLSLTAPGDSLFHQGLFINVDQGSTTSDDFNYSSSAIENFVHFDGANNYATIGGEDDQVVIEGAGEVSFVGAATFSPPNGTSLPASCAVGMIFFKTNGSTTHKIYACESTNTWVAQ